MTETISINDKRGQAKTVPLAAPPTYWTELVEVDQELSRVREKWGVQHHDFGFGAGIWAAKANEEKRINERRAANGNDSWLHIILEEVYEAFAEKVDLEDKGPLYGELIQAAAMFLATAEDLRGRAA